MYLILEDPMWNNKKTYSKRSKLFAVVKAAFEEDDFLNYTFKMLERSETQIILYTQMAACLFDNYYVFLVSCFSKEI